VRPGEQKRPGMGDSLDQPGAAGNRDNSPRPVAANPISSAATWVGPQHVKGPRAWGSFPGASTDTMSPGTTSIGKTSPSDAKKEKRHQINRACPRCRASKAACKDMRPCPRCMRLGLADECLTDDLRAPRKRRKKAAEEAHEVLFLFPLKTV